MAAMSFRPFGSLRGYRTEWLSGDAIAGLTVWAVLVPEALAYATIAGAPPVVGLYAATTCARRSTRGREGGHASRSPTPIPTKDEVHPRGVKRRLRRGSTVPLAERTRPPHVAEGSVPMGTYERGPVKGMAGAMFAAVMMLTLGVFQGIQGLVAIFNDDWYIKSAHYTFDLDITAWGWIHLILGILMIIAGWALFSGQLWAALTTMFLCFISAIENFFFIPYYPFWSILIIALNIWVIWSLTRPGVIGD